MCECVVVLLALAVQVYGAVLFLIVVCKGIKEKKREKQRREECLSF